jgi:hypothetical protein
VAEKLGTLIRQPDSQPVFWPSLCKALATVCRRLPASDAASHVNRTVDYIIAARDATKEKGHYLFQAEALAALSGRLDAARASRTAGAILAFLGDVSTADGAKIEFISHPLVLPHLTKVAERLDASGGLRAAEELVLVLRRSKDPDVVLPSMGYPDGIERLRRALVGVCKPLDAAGAAQVAEAMDTAVRDPKTSVSVRSLFADGLAALADRLTPDQAASLESGLIDSLCADLANAKSPQFRGVLGRALAAACGRPGATGAARAAEALTAAIRDPQTPAEALKPLAAALAAVIGQLPPKEASSHAKHAVDGLDFLWSARTTPFERATLAEAMAAVWVCLGPADASARAKRAAADLEDVLPNAKAAPSKISGLGMALSAVYNHLDPAERSRRANAVLETLVAARRRPRRDSLATVVLSEALATLCAHLDRPGDVRIGDALLAVLDDPNVELPHFVLYERMFQQVAPRLDERDLRRLLEHPLAAGRVQRVLLDVLAGSKNRSFRNTWDYLDATGV